MDCEAEADNLISPLNLAAIDACEARYLLDLAACLLM
jgi:hypothetical protein